MPTTRAVPPATGPCTATTRTGKGWYHGGDLAGLRARLAYLEDMGVTALWITPPFTNRWVQGSSAGYHGYWQTDYTQIDPHLGSNAEMIGLIADAHGRGMKVYFDVVINHTADVITYTEGDDRRIATRPTSRTWTRRAPSSTTATTPAATRSRRSTRRRASPTRRPTTRRQTPTSRCPPGSTIAPCTTTGANSTFTGENSLYGDFVGLDDLFTEHPRSSTG